jgi:hypothetical protein
MFSLYHIKGVKWGCTKRKVSIRVKEQGYTIDDVCEVIEIKNLIDAAELEDKLNIRDGYKRDRRKYNTDCTIGGKISGNKKSIKYLKKIGKLGNQSNIEKYGQKIIATNIKTGNISNFNSIREAERKLNIQAPLIRRCLKNLQPKSKGYTFKYY